MISLIMCASGILQDSRWWYMLPIEFSRAWFVIIVSRLPNEHTYLPSLSPTAYFSPSTFPSYLFAEKVVLMSKLIQCTCVRSNNFAGVVVRFFCFTFGTWLSIQTKPKYFEKMVYMVFLNEWFHSCWTARYENVIKMAIVSHFHIYSKRFKIKIHSLRLSII